MIIFIASNAMLIAIINNVNSRVLNISINFVVQKMEMSFPLLRCKDSAFSSPFFVACP